MKINKPKKKFKNTMKLNKKPMKINKPTKINKSNENT